MSESTKRPFTVILTGGAASGKTAASNAFKALGVPVIDTDLIAREVVEPDSEGLEEIIAAFDESVRAVDGTLDRKRLRQLVFADPEAREKLEDILHPRIVEETERRLRATDAPYVILVVPLYVETGLLRDADRVLVVDAPEVLQIERLMARDRISRDEAEAMLNAQATRAERLEAADDVLENTAGQAALRGEVERLHRRYLGMAGN